MKKKIALISFPMGSALAVNIFLNNLLEILEPLSDTIYLVTSNINLEKPYSENVILKDIGVSMSLNVKRGKKEYLYQIFRFIIIQMKMSLILIQIHKNVDIAIFYVGGANLLIPVIVAKIVKLKIITSGIGSTSSSYKNSFISEIFRLMERCIFSISDKIMIESKSVKNFLDLTCYEDKIVFGARYIDTELFAYEKEWDMRSNIVGYIGRLSLEKGLVEFIRSMPIILSQKENIRFFIGGNGNSLQIVCKEIEENNLSSKVNLIGWIPHSELPRYLNDLKFLILPSYSEGLPTIVLEAMACGTPVIATPVGGIPDIIHENVTGFIIRTNSPECIAEEITKALDNPNIDLITRNARLVIEDEFSYESAFTRWNDLLKMI